MRTMKSTPRGTAQGSSSGSADVDLRDRRGDRDRDGEDVVDEEGAGSDQGWQPPEVLLGDCVGAAAVRVGDADLAIARRDHREQDGDGDGHLEAEGEGGCSCHDEHPQDLLGRVGARADGVRAEDGQRLRLAEALPDLLGRGQWPTEQDPPGRRPRSDRRRPSPRGPWAGPRGRPRACSGSTGSAAGRRGPVDRPASGRADPGRWPSVSEARLRDWRGRGRARRLVSIAHRSRACYGHIRGG